MAKSTALAKTTPESRAPSGPPRDAKGRFPKGVSGNAGGRPKGLRTYNVRALWAEALDDPEVKPKVVAKLKAAVSATGPRNVVVALESAARINREIGASADLAVGSVTINFLSPVRLGKLK